MSISANELAGLVEHASFHAAPDERAAALRVAAEIRRKQLAARADSVSSRWLRSAVDFSKNELGEVAVRELERVEVLGHEASYINALPTSDGRIVVFDGLRHLILFHTNLTKVLEQLQRCRPQATHQLSDGTVLPEALAFSLAGYSILADFLTSLHSPPVLADVLGPVPKAHALAAYKGAMCFVLLHELAHIRLGHLRGEPTRSETLAASILSPEVLTEAQQDELGADRYALALIPAEARVLFGPSIVFFFGAFAFIELFAGSLSSNHPLAVNRISALVDMCPMRPGDKQILVSWVTEQAERFREFAKARQSAGGSIRANIHATVPVALARETLEAIKLRVLHEHGLLSADSA